MAKKKKSGGLFNSIRGFFQEVFVKSDYVDYPLMFVTLFLVAFGLVMVYSTSSYTAELKLDQATYYLVRQGIFALLGVCLLYTSPSPRD